MQIYLVQHGKCHTEEEDPERKLTDIGEKEVRLIAAVAADHGVTVSSIRHSGKKRAHQTAEIFAATLGVRDIKAIDGMSPGDDVKSFSASLDKFDCIMYIGHLPFMSRLASYLVTGKETIAVFKFQNSGILCLEKEDPGEYWVIKWALMPKIN